MTTATDEDVACAFHPGTCDKCGVLFCENRSPAVIQCPEQVGYYDVDFEESYDDMGWSFEADEED